MTSPIRASWHVGRVASRRRETESAVRLELDVPTWPGNHAGSHLDVRLTAPDGYQATRSYSVASSGETTRVILAVEKLPAGEVSPYLVHQLAKATSSRCTARWDDTSSGSPRNPTVPRSSSSPVDPAWCRCSRWLRRVSTRRTMPSSDCCTRSGRPRTSSSPRSSRRCQRPPSSIVHTRRSPPGSPRPPGRLTRESVADSVFPASATPRIFVCGPTPFVETIAGWLLQLGHDPTRIRTERFGGSG